jgi:hypothetical protein
VAGAQEQPITDPEHEHANEEEVKAFQDAVTSVSNNPWNWGQWELIPSWPVAIEKLKWEEVYHWNLEEYRFLKDGEPDMIWGVVTKILEQENQYNPGIVLGDIIIRPMRYNTEAVSYHGLIILGTQWLKFVDGE